MSSRNLSDYQLIVFDMDGVIVDSLMVMKIAFTASINDYFKNEITPKKIEALFTEYRKHLGKGFLQIMDAIGLPHELHPYFIKHSRYLAPYVMMYHGVDRLLKKLNEQGKTLCIATGKDGQRATELLERLNLLTYFDKVTGSDQAPAKPSPVVLLDYMKHYKVSSAQTIMIGDSIADIVCAKNAQVASAAALWGYGSHTELAGFLPDYYFESPNDILDQLEKEAL